MSNFGEGANILRKDYQGIIQFDTLADLHNAVLVFGDEGDQSARQHNIGVLGESSGGFGALLFAMASSGGGGSFAQGVVRQIGNLDEPYEASWDHDGPGSFHKAFMQARRQEDGSCLLSIGASHVGNQPEIKLAERLGAPVAYHSCTITREYESSEDGRFRIPLVDVTSIYKAVGVDIDEESAFLALTTKVVSEDSFSNMLKLPKAVLFSDDPFERSESPKKPKTNPKAIKAAIGFVDYTTVPFWEEENHPDRYYEYRCEGGFLTGPARENCDGGYEPVRICVEIRPCNGPTFDRVVEQRIRQIGDVVEKAWGGRRDSDFKPAGTVLV